MTASVDVQPGAARASQPAHVLVALAGSAGAIGVLKTVLAALPPDLPAAIAIVQHRSPEVPSALVQVLKRATRLHVTEAREGASLESSTVYVAPADKHLTVTADRTLHIVNGHRIQFVLSSANPLLETASPVFGENLLAVVLTGADGDAKDGVQSVAATGGTVFAQSPASSLMPDMPRAAIETGAVQRILAIHEIAPQIIRFVEAHQPRI